MANNITNSPANVEQNPGDALLGEKKAERPDSLCCIHVHSIRKRLTDPDGISAKAAIDALVSCGILPDDSDRYVKEVRYSQEKTKGEEKTIITLEWED